MSQVFHVKLCIRLRDSVTTPPINWTCLHMVCTPGLYPQTDKLLNMLMKQGSCEFSVYVGGDPPQGGQNLGPEWLSSWAKEGSSPQLIRGGGGGRGVLAWAPSFPAPHYTGWGRTHLQAQLCSPSRSLWHGAGQRHQSTWGQCPPSRVCPVVWLTPQYIWWLLRMGLEKSAEKVREFFSFPTNPIPNRASARAGLGRPAGAQCGCSAARRRRFGPCTAHLAQRGVQALQPEVPVDSSEAGGTALSCHRATCQ